MLSALIERPGEGRRKPGEGRRARRETAGERMGKRKEKEKERRETDLCSLMLRDCLVQLLACLKTRSQDRAWSCDKRGRGADQKGSDGVNRLAHLSRGGHARLIQLLLDRSADCKLGESR